MFTHRILQVSISFSLILVSNFSLAQKSLQPYITKLDGTTIEYDSIAVKNANLTAFSGGEETEYKSKDLMSYSYGKDVYKNKDSMQCFQLHRYRFLSRVKNDSLFMWEFENTRGNINKQGLMYHVIFAGQDFVIFSEFQPPVTKNTREYAKNQGMSTTSGGLGGQRFFLEVDDKIVNISFDQGKKRKKSILYLLSGLFQGTEYEQEINQMLTLESTGKLVNNYGLFLSRLYIGYFRDYFKVLP